VQSCPFPSNLTGKGQAHAGTTFVRKSAIARLRRSPLGSHLDPLATSLHNEGYAPISIQRFLFAAEKFAYWLQDQGYSVDEMDEDLLRDYLSGLTRYRSGLNLGLLRRGAIEAENGGKSGCRLQSMRRGFARCGARRGCWRQSMMTLSRNNLAENNRRTLRTMF
jgi:hypothetical protein